MRNVNIRFRNRRSLSDKKNRASAIYRPTFGDRNTRRTPFTIYAMHLKSNSSERSHLPTRRFCFFFKLTVEHMLSQGELFGTRNKSRA